MTERPLTVRPAEKKDIEPLFDLLCMAYKENAPFRMSEKKVRNTIEAGVGDREVVIGIVEGKDGVIAGSIGAAFSQFWYSDDWYICEFWNFVHPDYRKSTYAKDLISYAKWIAENMDMALHLGIITTTRMEAKIRLYQRQAHQVGAFFVHNMKAGHGPLAMGDING